MRLALAAAVDVAAVAILGFLAFRLGIWGAQCGKHMDNCFILNPLIILLLVVSLGLYFGVGYRVWRSTPGKYLLRVEGAGPDDARR